MAAKRTPEEARAAREAKLDEVNRPGFDGGSDSPRG